MADLPVGNEGELNGTTAVEIVRPPTGGRQMIVPTRAASVRNADNVSHVITFQKIKGAIPPGFTGFGKFVLPDSSVVWRIALQVETVPAGVTVRLRGKVVLDATDETIEAVSDAAATTTEPTFDTAALEAP